MINNLEFAERLKTMMNFYELTATALADSIGIQRSSISHLLSGRNKPSLDFVLKILEQYKEVELYWLLNGKGVFPKPKKEDITPPLFSNNSEIEKLLSEENEIDKIIVFYKNGTYKSYSDLK